MEEGAAEGDAAHDGQDVGGVLAVGGKSDDGEDAAQGGAVQVAPDEQDVRGGHQAVDPHVDEDGGSAEHTQVVAGGTAGGKEQAAVAGPCGPGRLAAQEQS